MARTSGAIGMPTQTGTHPLVVGWSAKRKLFGFYGGISPCEVSFPPAIGWSLLARLSEGLALQLQSAKQLRVCSHDDGRNAHRDCAHAHGEIESPMDEKAAGDRNSD